MTSMQIISLNQTKVDLCYQHSSNSIDIGAKCQYCHQAPFFATILHSLRPPGLRIY